MEGDSLYAISWGLLAPCSPARIGEGLHNSDGTIVALFSKFVGYMEYNEEQALAILGSALDFCSPFPNKLLVEGDSLYAIS